jgi:hypothetical protein
VQGYLLCSEIIGPATHTVPVCYIHNIKHVIQSVVALDRPYLVPYGHQELVLIC